MSARRPRPTTPKSVTPTSAPPDPATSASDPTDVPAAAHRRRGNVKPRIHPQANASDPAPEGPAEVTVVTVRPVTPPGVGGATPTDLLVSKPDGTSAGEKAVREPADWAHFAPRDRHRRPVLTWLDARTRRLRHWAGHEWALATVASIVLACFLNREALVDPAHTLPQDVWDPSLVAYLIAWGGHALATDPAQLWHLNAFYPAQNGLAFSDSLLGYAPLAMIGTGPEAAVLRYNLIFIGAQALALVGTYALVRQLGIGRAGAVVGAVAFTLAPWRLGQAGHLQVLSTGGITLALAMLARGHGVRWRRARAAQRADEAGDDDSGVNDANANDVADPQTPPPSAVGRRWRPGWVVAGWLVASWQLTLGFGIGLAFAYVLGGSMIAAAAIWVVRWRRRQPGQPPYRVLIADLTGGLVFCGTAFVLAQPYLAVAERYPFAKRTADLVALYSPPLRGFVTAPPESWLWGTAHAGSRAQLSLPAEMDLLPGFTLYALAIAGVVWSVWRWRVRLLLAVTAVVIVALAMGTQGPAGGRAGYLLLLENLPGFDGLRTPGRLVIWLTLVLALLASAAVDALAVRAGQSAFFDGSPHPEPVVRWALVIPALLVVVEGIGVTPHVPVPAPPPHLSMVAAPYLVLPSDEVGDMPVMLWSTDRFAPMVNGGSGLLPTETAGARAAVQRFPDPDSVAALRRLGVKTVVVVRSMANGSPWQAAEALPIDGLGLTRDVYDDVVVFHLS